MNQLNQEEFLELDFLGRLDYILALLNRATEVFPKLNDDSSNWLGLDSSFRNELSAKLEHCQSDIDGSAIDPSRDSEEFFKPGRPVKGITGLEESRRLADTAANLIEIAGEGHDVVATGQMIYVNEDVQVDAFAAVMAVEMELQDLADELRNSNRIIFATLISAASQPRLTFHDARFKSKSVTEDAVLSINYLSQFTGYSIRVVSYLIKLLVEAGHVSKREKNSVRELTREEFAFIVNLIIFAETVEPSQQFVSFDQLLKMTNYSSRNPLRLLVAELDKLKLLDGPRVKNATDRAGRKPRVFSSAEVETILGTIAAVRPSRVRPNAL